MPSNIKQIKTIDDYIESFPENVKLILTELRETIRRTAPMAQETINYGIPTFKLKGNLVHFAAYKKHIGFYPTPSGISEFINELSDYEISKGSIKFPISKPLPLDVVERIVQFRVQENLTR